MNCMVFVQAHSFIGALSTQFLLKITTQIADPLMNVLEMIGTLHVHVLFIKVKVWYADFQMRLQIVIAALS